MKTMYVVICAAFLVLAVSVLASPGEPMDGPYCPGAFQRETPGRPQPMEAPPPMMGPHPMAGPQQFARLNLSKEQMDKMWQLEEKLHSDTGTIRYEVFQRETELKKLFMDPKAEDAAILIKQKELNAAKEKVDVKMMEFMLAQKKILTAEQLKKIDFPMGMGMKK
jgi:Spy/CpxP family protein refolding chaperone